MTRSDGPGISSVHTNLDILEAVEALDGAGVSEIARHLDRSKGGVYKHVRTLTDRGYLVTDGTTYRLGLRYWTLGTNVRDRLVPEQLESVVDDLAASIGHPVILVMYDGAAATVLYYQELSETTVRPVGEGESLPLHATAAGKAVLAYLPTNERQSVLDGNLPTYTDETVTDPDGIAEALETVREQRLARNHGEYMTEVESIAAPIIDASGYPRGSIAVISRTEELLEGDLEADASLVVSASKSLENALTD